MTIQLPNLGVSEAADILQVIISLLTGYFLYRTFILQKRGNDQQKALFEMDVKAKRGEYLPTYKIDISYIAIDSVDDNFGGTFPGEHQELKFNFQITDKAITNFTFDVNNRYPNVFSEIKSMDLKSAIYKKGDNVILHFLKYNFSDCDALTVDDKEASIIITFRFEDIIGNKYLQSAVYRLKGRNTIIFPLISES